MVRYLFYTIGDLTYQSPLVHSRFFRCLCSLKFADISQHTVESNSTEHQIRQACIFGHVTAFNTQDCSMSQHAT